MTAAGSAATHAGQGVNGQPSAAVATASGAVPTRLAPQGYRRGLNPPLRSPVMDTPDRQSSPSPPFPHDAAYKAMYSHPRVVRDLLRACASDAGCGLHPATLDALDLDSLCRLPAEWVTEDFRRRHGDQVWRIRWRRRGRAEDAVPAPLLLVLEFQSRVEPGMALRILGYTVELYRDLDARGVVRRSGRYPPVLPIVVHNGPSPWTAPARVSELIASPPASDRAGAELAQLQPAQAFLLLDFATCPSDDGPDDNVVLLQIGFERARSVQELAPLLRALLAVEDEGLRRTMYHWVRLLLDRLHFDLPTLEELEAMGSLDEFRSGLETRARGWTEQWFADGREQGQRDLLERQAAVKFGSATAARLAPLLARVTAPTTFAEIGEWLLACGTGEELVSRVESALPPAPSPEL